MYHLGVAFAKNGVVISEFTYDKQDTSWTPDNEQMTARCPPPTSPRMRRTANSSLLYSMSDLKRTRVQDEIVL